MRAHEPSEGNEVSGVSWGSTEQEKDTKPTGAAEELFSVLLLYKVSIPAGAVTARAQTGSWIISTSALTGTSRVWRCCRVDLLTKLINHAGHLKKLILYIGVFILILAEGGGLLCRSEKEGNKKTFNSTKNIPHQVWSFWIINFLRVRYKTVIWNWFLQL